MTTPRSSHTDQSTRSGRRSLLRLAAATFAVGSLALCGCGAVVGSQPDAGASPAGPGATPQQQAPTSPSDGEDGGSGGEGGVVDSEGNDAGFPRSVSYGFLDVVITDAVFSDEHPSDPNADEPSADYVGLDLTVTNTWTRGNLSIPAGVFQLDTDDGAPIPGFTEDGSSLAPTGGRSVDARVWYEVPDDTDMTTSALVIQEARNGTYYEPAVLPLLGEVNPEQRLDVAIPHTEEFAPNIQVGIEIGQEAGWVDFDVAVDEDGDLGAGSSWASALGRAPEGRAFLHIPGQAEGTPVQPVPLTFNGINYGIPALATAEGANNPVSTTFPDLNGRFQGEFGIFLTEGAQTVEFRIGCPCGGLLTGSTIEDEILSVTVDVSAVDALRHDV